MSTDENDSCQTLECLMTASQLLASSNNRSSVLPCSAAAIVADTESAVTSASCLQLLGIGLGEIRDTFPESRVLSQSDSAESRCCCAVALVSFPEAKVWHCCCKLLLLAVDGTVSNPAPAIRCQ